MLLPLVFPVMISCASPEASGRSLIIPVSNERLDKCITREQNFWAVCLIHFSEAKSVALNILYAKDYYSRINTFSDELLTYLYLHIKLNKTITIRKQFFRWGDRKRRHAKRQMRSYFGEPEDAYIVLIWNSYVLDMFLGKDPKLIFPNPRATYFVLLLEPNLESCERTDREVAKFLPRFWRDFGILNLIVNAPCTSASRETFMYDPFFFDGVNWGRVRRFDILEILEDPKKILFNLKDLKGYPLNVSIFRRTPTAVNDRNLLSNVREDLSSSGNFGGMDGLVLSNMVRYLNFSTNIHEVEYDYGSKLNNGTLTGTLGDVVYKRSDFAANSRFLIDYGTASIEFTWPVSNDLLCVIVPKSRRIPQWIMIFHCFALETWLFITVTFVVILVAWYLIRFSADIINRRKDSRSPALEICSILFSVPIKLHRSFTQRIFVASCLALNVIIMGIFQGSLVTSFSIVSYYADIETLDDVADSSLRISTKLDLLNHDISSCLMLRLARKKLTSGDTPSLYRAAYIRDVAAIERKEDAKLLIKTNYTGPDGFPLLHVVSECPWSYFLTYIVPKGSPFLPKFNTVLIRFSEAGLIKKWYQDTIDAFIINGRYDVNATTGRSQNNPFSLADMKAAFYLLSVGIVTATVSFLFEVFLDTYWIRYKFTP